MRRSLSLLAVAAAMTALAALVLAAGRTTTVTAQQTESIELFRGCNNVSLTWPTGTATSAVAAAISPASNLVAIWRLNNVSQTFSGFSAQFPANSDLTTVNVIDAVFVCMTGPGTMARPVLPPGGSSSTVATAMPTSAATNPTATSTTTATTQPQITFISSPVARGGAVQVGVQTAAGATCGLLVSLPGGGQVSGSAVANANGIAALSAVIPPTATAGTASVIVTCGGQSAAGAVIIT